MNEFDIIRRYLAPLATSREADGLRDDVAEIVPGSGRLIATADAIVEGVHFLPSDPIDTVAAKLVRVNVSDIVAKGGKPDGALLTLIWPKSRALSDVERFAAALGRDLSHWGAHLLGGDTTSTVGPLTLSLTLLGRCGVRGPVRRAGAKAGEDVWVTGVIGDGWLGLRAALGDLGGVAPADREHFVTRYRMPEPPPLAFADVVAEFASASVDISDGLVADATHVAQASGVAIDLDWMDTPLSDPARRWLASAAEGGIERLVTGGDDYQTLFTASREAKHDIAAACAAAGVQATRIGRVEEGEGVRLIDGSGRELRPGAGGWAHFSA